jgi:glycosyltransferase family protein
MDTKETLNKIIKNRISFSRFGDGEFYLAWGVNLSFQKFDSKLQKDLLDILNINDEHFLVGLPDVFQGLDEYADSSARFWKSFVGRYYGSILKIVPMDKIYGNTNCTRFYTGYRDKDKCSEIIDLFKKIWDGRDIICIEGEKTRMGVGNDLFGNCSSFKRILAPAENAYDVRDAILTFIKEKNFSEDILFILALGPTATVLAYDLYKLGYQALDLGHLDIQYEYSLRHAVGKIKIEGKYTNEAKNGNIVTDNICDEKYYNSIIEKFI